MRINRRRRFISALFLILLFFNGQGIALGSDNDTYLEGLIKEVLERNPDLIKAREKKSATEHLVLPSGTLPDPNVGFSFSNFPTDTFDFDQEPMTSFDLFFTQKFPFPGKLSLKEEIAEIRSQQAGKTVSELENMLIYRTRRAYFRLYDISQAINITKKTRAILKQILGVAKQRYAVGKALQQDVFRAQTAVSNIDRRLFDLDKMRIEIIALINTLRSKQVDTDVTVTRRLPIDEIGYSEEELVESAKQWNPTLARLQLKIVEGEKGVSLARRELYPDFALSTRYRFREDRSDFLTGAVTRYRFREDRSDFLTGAVTLTVPLYASRKQKEIISSRKFELKSTENGYESYLDLISFNVREIKSDLFSLKNRISLLDSAILPEARNTVESAMSAYTVGKLEFLSLVSAELAMFKYELELSALKSKYNERVAELWMVTGKTLGQ
jgi:outer membrane protein TolC